MNAQKIEITRSNNAVELLSDLFIEYEARIIDADGTVIKFATGDTQAEAFQNLMSE